MKRVSSITIVIFIFIAIEIRLALIFLRTYPSNDELWAVLLAQAPFNTIWQATFADLHGPFYFLMLRAIYLISQLSWNVFNLRLLSLIFSILASFGIWHLGNLILGKKGGQVCFLLSLFLPALIQPSVFGRYYSLLILIITVSIITFIYYLKYGQNRSLILLIFFSTIGIYTHYYFGLLNISLTVFLLISNNRSLLVKWLITQIIIAILFLPGIYFLLTLPKPELTGRHENSWLKLPTIITANVMSAETLIFLYLRSNFYFTIPVIVILTLVTVWLLILGLQKWGNELQKLLLVLITIPPLITVTFTYTIKPLMSLGALQIFVPAFIVVLARGIMRDSRKVVSMILLFLVVLSIWFLFITSQQFYGELRKDFIYFKNNYNSKDLVLHSHLGSYLFASNFVDRIHNYEIIHNSSVSPQTALGVGLRSINLDSVKTHRGGVWYFESPFVDETQSTMIKTQLSNEFILVHEEKFLRVNEKTQETFFNVYYYRKK